MSDAERALASLESGNRLSGLAGLSGLYGQRQQGRLAGMSGMGDLANVRLGALNSLRGLRSDTPGEVGLYQGGVESGLGMYGNQRGSNLNQRMQYTPNRDFLDNLGRVAGVAAPFVSAFAGGGGNMPNPFRGRGGSGGF